MAISSRLRFEILRRDNFTCRYCGANADASPLTIDHVIPTALGGPDTAENLVAACQDCNAGKSSTTPDAETVADVSADALMWAQAKAQARDEHLEAAHRWDLELDAFHGIWTNYGHEDRDGVFHHETLPADWRTTVCQFLNDGLPFAAIEEFIHITMSARLSARTDRFRYFCGCCHNRIRDLDQRALAIYEDMKKNGGTDGS